MVIEVKQSHNKIYTYVNAANVQKEYKNRHDWVRKRIQKELCKKMKFDHTE